MKVLHLISGGDTGGAKTHVLGLLGELKTSEDVRLICLREGVMSREAEEQGIPCTVLSGGFFAQLRAVRAMVTGEKFELLHCHGSRANVTGALLKRSLACPVISTVHSDPGLDYLGRPLAAAVFGTANRQALRRMDALVCVSRAMTELMRSRGYARRKLFTIYNGPDLRTEPVRTDTAAWLAAHGIPAEENVLYVGCAARLDPVKDHATLLRGFALAEREEPGLRLVLAGDGSERERLKALCRELGVEKKVFFPGWVEDMEGYCSLIDINALSSLSETFPYSLTEGARYGIPAAASAVGGIPDLIEDGATGRLFAPGDAEALGRALLELARDGALRRRLGQSLRDRVRESFSREAMGKRQREIYRTVLTPRRGIVIAGACGMGNPGDEAMLRVILERIRALSPNADITVLSHRPEKTAAEFGTDSVYYLDLFSARRALRRSYLLLCGGGNLLQDATSRRSLRYYLSILRMGRRAGCRVVLFGAGLGPLSGRGLARTVRTLNETADAVVFREEDSLTLAREAGVTEPELTLSADPVQGYPLEDLPRAELRERYALPEGAVLLFLRRRPGGTDEARKLAASAAAWAEERGKAVFLLPWAAEDERFCAALADALPVLPRPETEREAAALVSMAGAVLSERLHALVFARRMGVPAAGIACDGRIPAFLRDGALWRRWGEITENTAAELLSAAVRSGGCPATEAERLALNTGLTVLDREVLFGGPKAI